MANGPLQIQEQWKTQEAVAFEGAASLRCGAQATSADHPQISAKMVEAGEWVLSFAASYPSDLLVAAIFRAMSEAREPVEGMS